MTLQQLWDLSKSPDVGDICFRSGRIISFQNQECSIAYQYDERMLNDYGREGYDIEIFEERKNDDGMIAFRGAGTMGNVGVLALADDRSNILWTMVLNFSNPLVSFKEFDGDKIVVTSEIDYEFFVPLSEPEKMRCISHNRWGY